MRDLIRALLAAVVFGGLVGCGWLPTQESDRAATPEHGVGSAPERPAAAGLSGRRDLGAAMDLLQRGRFENARTLLAELNEAQPESGPAALLLEQLITPAEALMPGPYRQLRIEPGDSLSRIAEREFGNPLLFVALARLNGIEVPGNVAAGTMLRVPAAGAGITGRGGGAADAANTAAVPETISPATRPAAQEATPDARPQAAGADRLTAEAKALMMRGDLIEAYHKASEAVASDPGHDPAVTLAARLRARITVDLHDRAVRAWRDREVDRAIRTWEALLEVAPDFEPAQVYLERARELRARLGEP
ncbi:MAG: LysM peptidoglycan-binding domain-containing protein [Wenzhouxiangellaceae bacterium]|nr:LysM peptidoglycan-binding domain-containing protein [Wenzhouxiangellaceae bacterium]